MSARIERRLFTIDDFARMDEAGIFSPEERLELLNGELIVVKPTGPRHGAAVDGTIHALVQHAKGRAIVRVQGCVVLHQMAAPLPDIALLAARDDYYVSKNPGPDDILLIVEVSDSTLELDSIVKLQLYAITGIREYWIADLRHNRLLVHSDPAGDGYGTVKELHRGDTVAPASLPDCLIPVNLLLP